MARLRLAAPRDDKRGGGEGGGGGWNNFTTKAGRRGAKVVGSRDETLGDMGFK